MQLIVEGVFTKSPNKGEEGTYYISVPSLSGQYPCSDAPDVELGMEYLQEVAELFVLAHLDKGTLPTQSDIFYRTTRFCEDLEDSELAKEIGPLALISWVCVDTETVHDKFPGLKRAKH